MSATQFDDWVGRGSVGTDVISPVQVRQMGALLNQRALMDDPKGSLPAGWHWCYFNPIETTDRLGADGHPERGSFLPPVPLPRRMWAGSRLAWERPFDVASEVCKRSSILRIIEKAGRNGAMVFVTVEHCYSDARGDVLREEHDIVYRDLAGTEEIAAMRGAADAAARWRAAAEVFERQGERTKAVFMGPVELFRYSAATFNGHRIHYDLAYCQQEEGYPAQIVHGPLIATLLLDFMEREIAPGRRIATFQFRAVQPTFALPGGFHLHASPDPAVPGAWRVWSTNNTGRVGLDGMITLGESAR
ncbi:MAG: acyl-CoA dehydrogenase [Alcaligenaceae bacterium]|nr:acyl-CoA dehydrogenase [Alcaligenaceae bacterium SAGV5]MPS53164.1 acyl-CoA dehydrogenase [Alcaligenaceae bacterium SAGV3]MPT55398.1 acyl-CoA dehydrogenase [Alcaligenaceae bacterium]